MLLSNAALDLLCARKEEKEIREPDTDGIQTHNFDRWMRFIDHRAAAAAYETFKIIQNVLLNKQACLFSMW